MRERATEGWPEGHPGGEGNRSGDCQRQPLWGEKSGSERVNIGSGNERVKGHGEHGGWSIWFILRMRFTLQDFYTSDFS